MTNEFWKHSFAPVIGYQAKVLILGSLPGDVSLEKQQYYAHPRNQFWRLLGDCAKIELHGLPYEQKILQLQTMPVIVWDVVQQAKRHGSLDAHIQQASVHDLSALLEEHKQVQQIWFNGQRAAGLAKNALQDALPQQITLPSSSPAHTLAYERKLHHWQQAWQQLFGV